MRMVYLFVENRQRNLAAMENGNLFFLAEHLVLLFLMEYSMNHKFGRTMERQFMGL